MSRCSGAQWRGVRGVCPAEGGPGADPDQEQGAAREAGHQQDQGLRAQAGHRHHAVRR